MQRSVKTTSNYTGKKKASRTETGTGHSLLYYFFTISVVFGTELAHSHGSLPHFALAECLELFLKLLAVVGLGVAVD